MADMNATAAETPPAASVAELLRHASAFEKRRQFDRAATTCREALALDGRSFDAWFLLSGIEAARGDALAALDAIDRGLEAVSESAVGLCRRGSILRRLKRNEEAAESQRKAIAIDPLYAEAHNNLGNCLRDLQRPDEALQHYQRAIEAKPDYAQAHNNLGVVQKDLGQDQAALESFRRSLALNPRYANAYFNLGTVLLKLERPAEAAEAFRRTTGLAPRDGGAHLQLAGALMFLGRFGEAEPHLKQAVALGAGNAEAEFDLSLLLLERGFLKEGWKHYEARLRLRDDKNDKRPVPFAGRIPQWTGEPLEGRSILVQSEQGLGDILQFCRYVPLLVARGARVTFLVPTVLKRLLAPIAAVCALTSKVKRSATFDYRCHLVSLPGVFGTELQSIPRTEGPYLFPEQDRLERWRRALGETGFKIAVCWQGNPNVRVDKGRSIPLAAFAPLAALPGVRLISLQKRYGLDQLANLPPGMAVEQLGPSFDEGPDAFLDSAAVIANCDLVVTSDTSIAHLAGALDAPTWIALSTTADWRWLRGRRDSPWYRSATLFRQREAGDWPAVLSEIAETLGGMLAENPKAKL